MNNLLLRALLANQEAWEFTTVEEAQDAPIRWLEPHLELAL